MLPTSVIGWPSAAHAENPIENQLSRVFQAGGGALPADESVGGAGGSPKGVSKEQFLLMMQILGRLPEMQADSLSTPSHMLGRKANGFRPWSAAGSRENR